MAAFYDLFYGALNLLILLAAGAAVVVALVMRKKYPRRATYATLGFALFALATLTYLVSPWLTRALDLDDFRLFYLVINTLAALLQVASIGLLVLALFRSDETPRQPGQPQYGQPPAQGQQPYGQPQYQQPPPQMPQQQYGPPPGQQPPQQAPHPQQGQQPPQQPQPQYQQQPQGQPYPGQQPPQQGQQQPPQPPHQYPGSGY